MVPSPRYTGRNCFNLNSWLIPTAAPNVQPPIIPNTTTKQHPVLLLHQVQKLRYFLFGIQLLHKITEGHLFSFGSSNQPLSNYILN